MTSVYLADAKPEECSTLCLLLYDLKMDLVGEGTDWFTTLAQAPVSHSDLLLVDSDLFPSSHASALEELRKACPAALVVVLNSNLDTFQQTALSASADAFICKGETPMRVAQCLWAITASIPVI